MKAVTAEPSMEALACDGYFDWSSNAETCSLARHKKTLHRFTPRRAMRLATRFVAAVAASPFGIPPCPGRQVGEGNCPAQDAG
jgi:hypothetical protein